jgi:hypothetical protein
MVLQLRLSEKNLYTFHISFVCGSSKAYSILLNFDYPNIRHMHISPTVHTGRNVAFFFTDKVCHEYISNTHIKAKSVTQHTKWESIYCTCGRMKFDII